MFSLFKRSTHWNFDLFKLAGYSKSEILSGLDTKKGQAGLRGLLWEIARSPASESTVQAAVAKLKDFINSATPDGLESSREGESAWWLRDLALATPYDKWDGLLSNKDILKSDLKMYWDNWGRLKEIVGDGATQLSSLKRGGARSGEEWLDALDEVIRSIGNARMTKIDASREHIQDFAAHEVGYIGDWHVAIPLDTNGSRYLGAKTSWCTAGKRANELFNWYSQPEAGKYIYVVTNTRTGDRYQAVFHNQDDIQVRDENDVQVSPGMAQMIWTVIKNAGALPKNAAENASSHLLDLGPFGNIVSNPKCDEDGLPHADDEPALTKEDGMGTTSAWFNHGALHNKNGPAAVVSVTSGEHAGITQKIFYQNGIPHRENGLPHIESHKDGALEMESYLEPDGKVGRDPEVGPAVIHYNSDGRESGYEFIKNDKPVPNPLPGEPSAKTKKYIHWVDSDGYSHREGAPALISNPLNPDTQHETWFKKGNIHRPASEGPAVSGMRGNLNQYWVDGKRVRPDGTPYSDPVAACIEDMKAVGKGSSRHETWEDYAATLQDIYRDAREKRIDPESFELQITSIKEEIVEEQNASECAAATHILDDFANAVRPIVYKE